MTIIIDTKYNVGDSIYTADYYEEWYPRKRSCIITDILVTANSKGVNIFYATKQDGLIDNIAEDYAFSTYEECTKWCGEHN